MNYNSSSLLAATVAVVLLINFCFFITITKADSKAYLNNQEIYDTAKSLESAELLQDDVSNEMIQKRIVLLYNFARPPKSSFARSQFEKILKHSNEYKFKAYEFVNDNKKGNKNWFTGIKKVLGPIISMKNIAKKYQFLQDLTKHYENESKNGLLTNLDVDCDILKFKLSQLYNIFFVLQTDIKYLLIGDQQILNRAIYEQIKADKFSSPHNFYEVGAHELNSKQRELLKKYFSDHMNLLITNVNNSVDHFYNPGEFIFGRLLDSCQAINQFKLTWDELNVEREETCSKSNFNFNGQLFSQYYTKTIYEDIINLCDGLFEAM